MKQKVYGKSIIQVKKHFLKGKISFTKWIYNMFITLFHYCEFSCNNS